MRKIISFILLIFVFSCVTSYATETPTISIVQEESDVEKEISVNIQITEGSKTCGGKIVLLYDDMLITPESYQVESLVSNSTCMVNLNYEENVIRISWAGIEELVDAGVLCNIRFSVANNEDMTSEIQVRQAKIADMNGEPISVKTENCTIKYTKKENESTSRPTGGSGGLRPLKNNDTEQNDEVFVESLPFTDVKKTDWYYEAVKFAFEKGITSGVSETEYDPQNKVTRGQFITMLCRAYGIKEMTGDNFADCGDTWYTGYLAAAKQLGISNGVGDNKFAPEKEISREEMVTLIYNYLKSVGKVDEEISETTFTDNDSISSWAKNGVAFASSKGYVNGKGNNFFDPNGDATRAELAQIFFNMFK